MLEELRREMNNISVGCEARLHTEGKYQLLQLQVYKNYAVVRERTVYNTKSSKSFLLSDYCFSRSLQPSFSLAN